MARLELNFDRADVSVEDFTAAFETQIKLVREVMIEMNIPANEVRWVFAGLRHGSAYAAAAPQVIGKNAYMADIEQAIANTGSGFGLLEKSAQRPKFFNDEALKLTRTLSTLTTQSSAGKARLVFGARVVTPSAAIAANVNEIVRGDLYSIGSIEGVLVGVQGSDGNYRISILDRLRNRKVPCRISPELLKQALAAFETRVIVRGKIRSRQDGTPNSIEVRHFEVMPTVFPSWQKMGGILEGYERADDGD
jgi:hypothetical protein